MDAGQQYKLDIAHIFESKVRTHAMIFKNKIIINIYTGMTRMVVRAFSHQRKKSRRSLNYYAN